jgi:hypothetical protein
MLSLRVKAIKYRLSHLEKESQIPALMEHAKSIYFAATGTRLSIPDNVSLATTHAHALIAVLQSEAVIADYPGVCAADKYIQKLALNADFKFTDAAIENAARIYNEGSDATDLETFVMSCAILIAVDSISEFPEGILERYEASAASLL